MIALIGPPGAGKSTQAAILNKERGLQIISADELIAQNRSAFQRFARPEIQGVEPRLDPALNRLVEEKLRSMDLSKGVIFDGYPASKIHGDHMQKLAAELGLPHALVIHLKVSDDVVRKRLKGQQSAEEIEQGLKDYHREMDFAQVYFPRADIHEIDGTKPPQTVAKEIRKLVGKK